MSTEKGDKLFLKTFNAVLKEKPELLTQKLIEENKTRTIFTRAENQDEINRAGIESLKKMFKE